MNLNDIPPRLPFQKLPESEQNNADFVSMLLQNLGSRCTQFAHALSLFDFCYASVTADNNDEVHKWGGWLHIAAHAAASTVFLFDEDMEFLKKNVTECPTLGNMIDHKAKRAATAKFKQYFPGFAGLRHSNQHYASLYGTPEKMAEHVAGPVIVTGAIVNRTLMGSFKKRTVRLDITPETLTNLKEVRDLYWAVFRAIEP